ncbi:putative N-acetylmannosamine-6-phosphate 2-epimerase [bacterium]|nr:putative N-acetylmannosamine-6-phosphate 2-epimerase [bacterium]
MDLSCLKNKVIVSVQAAYGEPLYDEACINGMLQTVVNGGAAGVRVAGFRDVKNAKKLLNVPVIGLTKPKALPQNWREIVYITPTIDDVKVLIDADADIIAIDGTSRDHKFDIGEAISLIHANNKLAMADIATFEEGIKCSKYGFDIISTTLSGYTTESLSESEEPDFDLLKNLTENTKIPVFLEGRVWEPEHVKKAFELNAHSVVIGSAITRPQLIVKRFIEKGI